MKISVSPTGKPTPCTCPEENAGVWKSPRALIREPKFVLLDEPFAGIDPLAVGDIQGLVRALRDRGIGVLISDHNVRETLTICERAYLMVQGQVVLSGTPETHRQ